MRPNCATGVRRTSGNLSVDAGDKRERLACLAQQGGAMPWLSIDAKTTIGNGLEFQRQIEPQGETWELTLMLVVDPWLNSLTLG